MLEEKHDYIFHRSTSPKNLIGATLSFQMNRNLISEGLMDTIIIHMIFRRKNVGWNDYIVEWAV